MNLLHWKKINLTRPAILVFAAVMAWLVARSSIHNGMWGMVLYNADTLYIADFFSDLLNHPGQLSGWRFSPAPNFFPDMPIYATASLAGANFPTTVVLCAFLQIALLLDSCRSLARTARLRWDGAFPGAVMVLLTLCYWQYFHTPNALPKNNDIYWTAALMILGDHFGAVLASLWGLILIGGALQGSVRSAVIRGAVLGLLIVATGCSDLLYLAWFSAPAVFCLVCCLGFARGMRLRIALFAVLIAASSVLVHTLQSRFNPLLDSYHDGTADGWETMVKAFAFTRAFLFDAGRQNSLHAAIFGGAALLFAVYAPVRLILAFRRRGIEPTSIVRPLIAGFLAASPVACIAAGLYTGLFHDPGLPRYTLPVVYITWLGIGFAFAEAVDGRWSFHLPSWVRPAFLVGVIPVLCLFLGTRHYNSRLPPQPELACIPNDRALFGLGDYWRARLVDMFSGRRLQVEPLDYGAVPYWWITNRYWLTHRRDQPDTMPLYSFIDTRRLDPATLERHYGKPSRVVPCPGGDIWFYDDAAELTRRFMELYIHTPAAQTP
jgi:hypothetical protein